MPAPVIAGERVNLIDDHRANVPEQIPRIDVWRNQHDLERLGRRQHAIRRLALNPLPCTGSHVAMPESRSPSHEAAIAREPKLQIVEQRLDRAKIKDAQALPIFGEHPRQDRKKGGLRLAAGGRGQDDQMLARQDSRNDGVLKRPQLAPTQTVDDMVLNRRV